MTWSINWDATNGHDFANTISARLGTGPGNGDEPTEEPTEEPDDCTASPWSAETAYNDGDVVSHEGAEYSAQWWTQGEEPGTTVEWGAWELIGAGCTAAASGGARVPSPPHAALRRPVDHSPSDGPPPPSAPLIRAPP